MPSEDSSVSALSGSSSALRDTLCEDISVLQQTGILSEEQPMPSEDSGVSALCGTSSALRYTLCEDISVLDWHFVRRAANAV